MLVCFMVFFSVFEGFLFLCILSEVESLDFLKFHFEMMPLLVYIYF